MTQSQVDATNINATYPIAGVNNSSQGFRDNFSAIKSALLRTSIELTELRTNTVVKSPIPGIPMNNDFGGAILDNAQLRSYQEAFYDMGSVGTNTAVDFGRGNFQKLTTTNDLSLTFTNFPNNGSAARCMLWVNCTSADHRITLPNNVLYGRGADYVVANDVVFPSLGNYLIEFIAVDNGASFWITAISGLQEFQAGEETAPTYILPVASPSTLGGVKIDGITIGIYDGVISVIGGVPSDQRLKTNIETIPDPLNIVKQLRGVTFDFKDSGRPSTGVIAQEVETVLPELVQEQNDIKTVHYGNFAGVFIECIKHLDQQITELRNEIAQLRGSGIDKP